MNDNNIHLTTMDKLINVTNIDWDVGDELQALKVLPKELIVQLNTDDYTAVQDGNSDILVDRITDYLGWCIKGLEYENYSGPAVLPDVDFT